MPTTSAERTAMTLVGCYTASSEGGTGTGIGGFTGARPAEVTPVAEVGSPSFVVWHPTLPVVYAAVEEPVGCLATLQVTADGAAELDRRPSGGSYPCHVAVSPEARWLAVANYGDGTLGLLRLDDAGLPHGTAQLIRHSGTGPDRERQEGAHAHQAVFAGGLLLLADLGSDSIHRYVERGGAWVPAPGGPARLQPGRGPRHLVAEGSRRWVVGELDVTVTAYDEDADGRWHELGSTPSSTIPTELPAYPSHVVLHDGHLYVANRRQSTIAVFAVTEGAPAFVGELPTGGAWPRHFAVVDRAVVVANERSHELTWLPLDDGPVPSPVAHRVGTGSPTCIAVRP